MKFRWISGAFTIFSILILGCQGNKTEVDVSGIEVDVTIKRFEKELFSNREVTDIRTLENHYGSFVDIFTHQILSVPEGPDTTVSLLLNKFVNDEEVLDIYRLSDSAFKNLDDIEPGLTDFLKHLRYYYPSDSVPTIVTYISAFNYAVITTDSVIGIGLDMFLGEQTPYYPRLGIPKYMFTKFRREYIVPSVARAWFQSEYDISKVKNELLSQIIYQGKLLYFSKAMLPALHDTLLTGYTQSQLSWCQQNESNVWSYLIENKLLFSTDPSLYAKFVNDGPTTSGFPKESPGKTGAWIGWKIVNEYAAKNDQLSMQDILNESDAQKILEKSGYKPQK